VKIECGADSEHEFAFDVVSYVCHKQLLLGCAEPHPEKVGLEFVDVIEKLFSLVVGEWTIWGAVGSQDIEAIEPCGHPAAQFFGYSLCPAVEIVGESLSSRQLEEA
jgi:hypothetical protein